ncbi:MAG: metallophosphoesterase [Saprospiraceae bacterium]|nr:metallophosphoesterase [Saprospiraceae bacterium]
MKIVQITDLHVGREGEETFGVDVRANFLKIKQAILKEKPDHLVLSGDLCFDKGDKVIYQWIKEHLDEINIPYDVISGNHDDPVMLAEIFELNDNLHDQQLYFAKNLGGYPFLFLDTTTGIVSQEQLHWLKTELAKHDREVVIFMHHPPIKANVPFMDSRHALRNKPEVQQVLFNHPHPISIFTGHYHVEKNIRHGNTIVHITPSCYFQIDQKHPEFKVDHHRIGFREITLENGTIMDTVKYL